MDDLGYHDEGSASRSVSSDRDARSKFSRSSRKSRSPRKMRSPRRSKSPRKKHSRRHSRSRSRSWRSRSRSRKGRRYRSRSRSPLSRRRRHRGDREQPKESRCLGVFGLSLQTDERTLKEVFERYGPVEEIQIVYDYHTGRSRGFGFVYMKYTEDAVDAKENVPGMELDGKVIRVDYSITERAHTPTPGTYLGYSSKTATTSSRYHRSPSSRDRHRSYSRSPSRGHY